MEDFSTNESMLKDEIYALSAIFESDWILEDEFNNVYGINLLNSAKQSFYFQVIFPRTYPSSSPPSYSISAPWLSRQAKLFLNSKLEDIYEENAGNCIVFLWIEAIKEFIEDGVKIFENSKRKYSKPELTEQNAEAESELVVHEFKPAIEGSENKLHKISIKHGPKLTDRKSIFQAHVAAINSLDEIKPFLEQLKENKKIATATHNIMAYRLFTDNKAYYDCDDDGEDRAGGNLLRLLEILDVRNVIVVVTRWYGGILLGAARFKHINNVAKELLVSEGYIKEKSSQATKS